MAVLLTATNLRKHFGPEPVLADVSFQVRLGDKIGLIGPNGCGKTTLLNILAGFEETEKGDITTSGDIQIGYLEQRPTIVSGRTLREEAREALSSLYGLQKKGEEIAVRLSEVRDPAEHDRLARHYDRIHEELLRKDAYELDHRIERILHGVGFTDAEMNQETATFSGGELNRLGLAKLLLAEPDLMLLDEPSNHLDLAATEWLEEFLRTTSAAVILVSHDRWFLDRVTNRTLELYFGTVEDYPGNFSKYQLLKEDRLAVQTRTYEKYVEEVEKAKEFIRRHHYGMKAAQAEDRRKKLERLQEEPAALPRKISVPGFHFSTPARCGDIVFRVDDLTKGYGAEPLFRKLTFSMERGQRWGVIGPNGCGKTTFFRVLLGEEEPDAGSVRWGEGVRIGYFDQHLHVLDDRQPVVEAIRPEKKIFEEPARRKLLGAFGLTQDQQMQSVSSLSGGQRCRAALAKLSANDPNVMILDEPTNHLDLWARSALERAIRDFGGTVLFISHDRYFVDRVADHLLIIQPGGRFQVVEGNYTTFRDRVSKGLMTDPFLVGALENRTPPSELRVAEPQKPKGSHGPKAANPPKGTKQPSNRTKLSNPPKSEKSEKLEKSSRPPEPPKPWNQGAQESPQSKKESKNGPKNELKEGERDSANLSPPLSSKPKGRSGKPKNLDTSEKKPRKFPFRRVSDIEEEIFIRETQVMTLHEELARPDVQRSGDRVKDLTDQVTTEETALKELYAHWEEASELNW